jgi:prepilin-type processing-associated H-X9-DG protein
MIDANVLNLNGPTDITTAVMPLTIGSGPRHMGKVNALFGDGHVTAYRAADLNGNSKQKKAMLDRWFTLR